MSQNVHPIQFLEIDGLEVSSLEIGHKKGSRLIKNTSNKKIVAELKKKHRLLTFLVGHKLNSGRYEIRSECFEYQN